MRVIKEYRSIILEFLWDGRKPKICYKTLIQSIEIGGLKLLDIETRIEVNLLQWIKRLLTHQEMNTSKVLQHVWHTERLDTFLSYRNPRIPSLSGFEFYRIMLKIWGKYRAIRKETFWCNKRVGSCAVVSNQQRWEEAGIISVGDLCHGIEGRLISHSELTE